MIEIQRRMLGEGFKTDGKWQMRKGDVVITTDQVSNPNDLLP